MLAQRGRVFARRVAIVSSGVAVLLPVSLGLFTYHNDSTASTVLKTVSPISTNPRPLMEAADFVRASVVEAGHTLALDDDASYQDLQLAFFARVTMERTLRMRWPDFKERLLASPPDYVVVFERGRLLGESWVSLRDNVLTIGPARYVEVVRPGPPSRGIRIFQRQSRGFPGT